jgi:hypothetical protein
MTGDYSVWDVASALATIAAAIFAAWAAAEARKAAGLSAKQSLRSEEYQREAAIDAQWMRFQEFYKECIPLFEKHPGMPLAAYESLNGADQRRLHLTAIALLQALDLAYRAGDNFRADNIQAYLRWYEGPLATEGAIDAGAIMHVRTFEAWNEVRRKYGRSHLPNSSTAC